MTVGHIPKPRTLCVVRYRDASYSYKNIFAFRRVTPGVVTSCGRVRRVKADYVDIALKWRPGTGEVLRGIVIPRTAILTIKPLNQHEA